MPGAANTAENHKKCEIPEVDATGLPGNTRTWCDKIPN